MEISSDDLQSLRGLSDLPPIPQHFQSKNGQIVKTDSDIWYLRPSRRGGVSSLINWGLLKGPDKQCILTQRSQYLVKLYFKDCIVRKEPRTARHAFGCLLAFHRWLVDQVSSSSLFRQHFFDWVDFDEETIRSYLHFREQQVSGPDHDLSFIRQLYRWGVARNYPDFSPDLLRTLKTMRVRNFPKGHNVRFHHPTKGPFSPDEVLLIRDAIKAERGSDQDRVLVMLHLELGLNPYATAQLMNKDLKKYSVENSIYYQIDIPRIKKKIVHRETKRRPISNQLGGLLEKLQQGGPEDPLFHWLNQSWAQTDIGLNIGRFAKDADIKSPGTGSLLKVNPRRFRYTLATHMAEEGASKHHIAEILDHTDLQNVEVYVETVSSIADAIAQATDSTLGPVVKRFLGKVIDSAALLVLDGLPNAIIPAMAPHLPFAVLNSGGVGICGLDVRKDGLCRLFPPLSCYCCQHFTALRGGPHKEMLDSIENFIRKAEGAIDNRILKQLESIREAIKEFIEQLGTAVDNANTQKENEVYDG